MPKQYSKKCLFLFILIETFFEFYYLTIQVFNGMALIIIADGGVPIVRMTFLAIVVQYDY